MLSPETLITPKPSLSREYQYSKINKTTNIPLDSYAHTDEPSFWKPPYHSSIARPHQDSQDFRHWDPTTWIWPTWGWLQLPKLAATSHRHFPENSTRLRREGARWRYKLCHLRRRWGARFVKWKSLWEACWGSPAGKRGELWKIHLRRGFRRVP